MAKWANKKAELRNYDYLFLCLHNNDFMIKVIHKKLFIYKDKKKSN